MTRFSLFDRAEMRRLREEGYSLGEVAKMFGTSRQLVHRYTPRLTLDIQIPIIQRRQAEVFELRGDLWTRGEDALLEELWLRWKSVPRIAQSQRLKRSHDAIETRVRKLGLPERYSGHRPVGSSITLARLSFMSAPTSPKEGSEAA